MTFQSNGKDDDGEAQPSPGAYEVGYGKPPVASRFKKGRSGNPLGRPRKAKGGGANNDLGLGVQPAKKYLLEEAYRPVLVREGEQTIELPAIQAVFRAMGVAAMKGNRYAQRMMAELVQAIEAEARQARDDHVKAAIDYKCTWEEAIEQARISGRPEPQPIPHPDDVFIDFIKGDAAVCGPLTKEDKAEWDKLFAHLDQLQTDISEYAATYGNSRAEKKRAFALDRWKFEQKLFDRLNDNLPKRYRRFLVDRCWKEGASRPGQHCKKLWPNED